MADGSVVIEITADDSKFRQALEALSSGAFVSGTGAEASAAGVAASFVNAFAAAIAAAAPGVQQAAPSVIIALVSALLASGAPGMTSAAANIINALTGGIAANQGAVAEAGNATASAFTNAVGAQSPALSSAGGNIVAGLLAGIKGAWSSLTGWVSGAIGGLVGSVKGLLGIHSPSKVFAELGEFTALGFGKGFQGGFGSVERQVLDSTERLRGAVGAEMNRLGVGAALTGGVSGGVNTVTNNNYREKVVGVRASAGTEDLIRLIGLRLDLEDRRTGDDLVK